MRHGVEPLLKQRAHRLGFHHAAAALFKARAKRGDGFFQRADRGVGGGLGFVQPLSQALQRAVERTHGFADLIDLGRPGRRGFDRGDARFERGERVTKRTRFGLCFERGEAFGYVVLRVAQIADVHRARLAGSVFYLFDPRRKRQLSVAQIGDGGACRLAQTGRAFTRAGFCLLDTRDQRGLLGLQRVDCADTSGDLAFETDDFFKQRFTRAACFRRGFRAHFGDRAFDGAAGGGFRLRQPLAQFLLQLAQFVDRIGRCFAGLTRRFFRDGARFRQCPGDDVVAIAHFTGQERRRSFGAAPDFLGDGHLAFEPLLDAGDVGSSAIERMLTLDGVLFGLRQSPAQRFTGDAELIERLSDTFRRVARRSLRVFDARRQAKHGTVDRGDGAIKSGYRQLRAPFDRFNALSEAGWVSVMRAADAPIVFAFVAAVRNAVAAWACTRELLRRLLLRTRAIAVARLARERLVQILAKAHTLARRSFARCFSYFWVDALYAPALRATHIALAAF